MEMALEELAAAEQRLESAKREVSSIKKRVAQAFKA